MPSSDDKLKDFRAKCEEIGIPLEPYAGYNYPEAKVVSFTKGDKYWLNRYYIECLVCGNTFWRTRVDSRTSPLCGKCCNKLERIKQSKRTERKQTLHDAQIRSKAIDDFADLISRKSHIDLDEDYVDGGSTIITTGEVFELAEQLKGAKQNED